LATVPEMKPGMLRRDSEALLEVLARTRNVPARQWWDPSERPDPAQTALVKKLSAVAQQRAQDAQVSPTLLAPRRELLRLARGDAGGALLRGWRRHLVGEELLALCAA
jgi:ribonuclease D